MIEHFNIRVYALIINENNEVLLADEVFRNTRMTKFPGGGLQFGEGTLDCLKREAIEEFGQELSITGHFYTTDFFQKSLFYDDHQLISIYYLAAFTRPPAFRISDMPFEFSGDEDQQSFRWKPVSMLSPADLTFPIDQKVAVMLKDHFPR
jgi:8-oxo-dGTP diphosphatase